jgi:hypothetical protein
MFDSVQNDNLAQIGKPYKVGLLDPEMCANSLEIIGVVLQADFRDITDGVGAATIAHVIKDERTPSRKPLKIAKQKQSPGYDYDLWATTHLRIIQSDAVI